MKYAYDLHTVHTTVLQKRKKKNNICQSHSKNIHQLHNMVTRYPVTAVSHLLAKSS